MGITAGDVKALREKTGLPMMECKKALEESGGDEAQAIELLRKKGLAQVGKRAERATAEGRVFCHTADNRAVLVELLCETEPVAGTEDFVKLGSAAAEVAAKMDQPTLEAILEQPMPDGSGRTINDALLDVVNKIRENIKFGRVDSVTGHFGKYLHHDGRKGVLVEFSGPCPEDAAADVCMHITAMRPPYTRREEVDPQLVENERNIAAEQIRAQGKPENMIDKIVTGKLNRWYSEIVLLEQPFVKDDKQSVGEMLKSKSPDLTVNRVVRVEIGAE